MRRKLSKILVTGGAGFIGSAFVRLLLNRGCPHVVKGIFPNSNIADFDFQSRGLSIKDKVIVVDKLTYAGDLKRLKEVSGKYKFYKADICDKKRVESIIKKEMPDIIVHFAAETHVDRSILDATVFINTNVIGVQILLDLSRKYSVKKFLHVSSDEVYGDIEKGEFTEDSPLKPNNPYAASKAAADLLIRSYIRTYNFPAIIVRPCNNYGPWQYPEKLIPVVIYKSLKKEAVPIYARGLNVREWLYIGDCARGLCFVLKNGKIGQIYNLGSGHKRKNIEVVKKILNTLDRAHELIEFVKDRPGHDLRYSLDSSRIRKLGWTPKESFDNGLEETMKWYINNLPWLTSKVHYLRDHWKRVYSLK